MSVALHHLPYLRLATWLIVTIACAVVSSSATADRYWALLRDGSVRSGDTIKFEGRKDTPWLDERSMLETDNPVRVLRDTTNAMAQPSQSFASETSRWQFIEMTNGDRLLGRVQMIVTGEAAAPWPDHAIIDPTMDSGLVRVPVPWIRGITPVGDDSPPLAAGTVRRTDGRQLSGRSMRWATGGLRVLTDDGIALVPLDDIAALTFPLAEPTAPLPGSVFFAGDPTHIVRTVTTDGQALTHAPKMVETSTHRSKSRRINGVRYKSEVTTMLAVRPPWSLDTIYFDADQIVWQTFLADDERPLSLLPVVAATSAEGVQHFRWRRNRNVLGEPLQCGELASELGIGMHSRSRLTFLLPAGAKQFTTSVGIDRLAAGGGCVDCRVFRDDQSDPLWERTNLVGSDGLQQVGPLDITGAKTLTLEVDFANNTRPTGADPLDIRDWVSWLLPMVTVEMSESRNQQFVKQLVPEIGEWSLSEALLQELTLTPDWDKEQSTWSWGLSADRQPLTLSRRVKVDLTNAWLHITAAADSAGATHTILVTADGQPVGSTMNGPITTEGKNQFNDRYYILHEQADREIELCITAESLKDSRRHAKGVLFKPLRLQPLITGLPESGQPIRPDVPLTSLKPISATSDGQPLELRAGWVNEEAKLNVLGWDFEAGFGTPTGSEITYRLDPSWKKFVAVGGLADGSQAVGPYQVFVDDELVWTSQRRFGRNDQGEQMIVDLPAGGKTITLKLLGKTSSGAWVQAGFLTGQ